VDFMSDLFHPKVPWQFIVRAFEVMARTSRRTSQILAKRPPARSTLDTDETPSQALTWLVGEGSRE
jgi:protein gp37